MIVEVQSESSLSLSWRRHDLSGLERRIGLSKPHSVRDERPPRPGSAGLCADTSEPSPCATIEGQGRPKSHSPGMKGLGNHKGVARGQEMHLVSNDVDEHERCPTKVYRSLRGPPGPGDLASNGIWIVVAAKEVQY